MKNINLDNVPSYSKFDPSDMLRHIHDIPSLCNKAWEQAMEMKLPAEYEHVGKIVILGMGGLPSAGTCYPTL